MGNLGLLQALVFEPRKAFTELGERPRYWFPLLVFIFATVGVSLWYLGVVDLGWMLDQQLRSNPETAAQLGEERITQLVDDAAERRGLQMIVVGIFSPVVIVLLLMFFAAMYLLSAKVTNLPQGFRHWFSLLCWTVLPTVLAQVASALVLLTATTTQISQEDLQPLSLNALLFHREAGTPGYSLLTNVSVLHLWMMFLGVLAVRVWSRRSWLFSFFFYGWPTLLTVAIWAGFALR